MPTRLLAALLLSFTAACSPSPAPAVEDGPLDLTVSLPPPAEGYQLQTEVIEVPPMSEVYKCNVVRLEPKDGEKLVWIHDLESLSSLHSHHMNVNFGIFSVGDAFVAPGYAEKLLGVEAGAHDCDVLGDLMEEQQVQTLYPSQKTHQKGSMPDGVGFPLPLPLVLIMEHHYINTSTRAVKINAVLNLGTMAESQVQHVASAFAGGISDVTLPPKSRRIESRTCAVQRDINMFAISSHSHARGACFSMNFYDGASQSIAPEPFFVNKDWESPPILFFERQDWTGGKSYPLHVGDGIHWACHYVNGEDREVRTGPTADDEMCIFVAMGYPAKLSVAEVRAIMENPSLDSLSQLIDRIPCETVDTASPWPEDDQVFPLEPGYQACADLQATDSETP